MSFSVQPVEKAPVYSYVKYYVVMKKEHAIYTFSTSNRAQWYHSEFKNSQAPAITSSVVLFVECTSNDGVIEMGAKDSWQ